MTTKHNSEKFPRRDAFVNVTKLHEQTGGLLESIRLDLSHAIDFRLRWLVECTWCPADIKDSIKVTIQDMQRVLDNAKSVQTYLADHSRSVPVPVPFRCVNQPRHFKLVVVHGNRGQTKEVPAATSESIVQEMIIDAERSRQKIKAEITKENREKILEERRARR